MSRKLLALSIILSVNLGSCTSDPIKPFEVQQRWSKNMRQLGIVPVFPPREDFFVGDVYLTSYDPDSEFLNELYNRPFEDLHETEKQLIAKTNIPSLSLNSLGIIY